MILTSEKPSTILTPWLGQGLTFAQECLVSRGFGFVRGGPGVGKTLLGEYLGDKWISEKLPGMFKMFRAPEDERTSRLALRLLGSLIGSTPEMSASSSIGDITRLILDHCAKQAGTLLYVDRAQVLCPKGMRFFTSLLDAAQDQNISMGLMFSLHNPLLSLWEMERSPNYLGSLTIPAVSKSLTMEFLAKWLPDFQKTQDAYFAGEKEATEIANLIFKETDGNFERITGLWRSATSLGTKHLTTRAGVTLLIKRRHPEKFVLVAEPSAG